MQSSVKDANKAFPRTIREIVRDRSNAVGIVIVCACAVALSFLSEASPFSTAYPSVDSGVFTYIGEHILQGQMPYLDIFDHKGPLLYVINTIAAAIDGPQHATIGIWLCELAAILVAMATTYCMCRRFSRSWFAVLATCLGYGSLTYALFGGNYVQEFACGPVAIALYLFSGYVVRGPLSNKACFGIGVTAGAAFLLQPNMLAAWGVFGIGILIHMGISGSGKRIVPTIAWALAGFIVFCAPFLVWILAGGGMGRVHRLLFPVQLGIRCDIRKKRPGRNRSVAVHVSGSSRRVRVHRRIMRGETSRGRAWPSDVLLGSLSHFVRRGARLLVALWASLHLLPDDAHAVSGASDSGVIRIACSMGSKGEESSEANGGDGGVRRWTQSCLTQSACVCRNRDHRRHQLGLGGIRGSFVSFEHHRERACV